MCLWLLTACLGLLPANPSSTIVVVTGVPAPILLPTTAATTAATTRPPPPANMTNPPVSPTGTMPASSPATPVATPPATPPATSPANPPGTQPATSATGTTIGGAILSLTICNDPDIVCIFNPDETTTGPLPIDPRLGTTPSPSAPYQVPSITGYSAQVPSYDTAVKFPRQRRSVGAVMKDWMNRAQLIGDEHHIRKRQSSCMCVATGTCNRSGPNAAVGMIDIRIVTPGGGTQCPAGQEFCCSGTNSQQQVACGTLQTVPATVITPAAGQANFGEYPWQALVLTKQNDYIAGGVLIDQLNVLTVTHRMLPYIASGTAPNVKVRLGEWDAAGTYEPIPFQEYNVLKVFSHPSYNSNTLQYDITVLRLSAPVPLTPAAGAAATINRACLPPATSTNYTGQRCWVSGWGKNIFGGNGQYQQILKKIDVPIVAAAACQAQLQAARLGTLFTLDTTSFICAGGEANKDSCTGDGGSGLVCQTNGKWTVVGLVTWGLSCGAAGVPAVYTNVAALLPWLQMQIAAT